MEIRHTGLNRYYQEFVCVYIDDILVHSKSEKEHTSHLKLVLQKFYINGIIVSGQKSQFYRKNIAYLGVEIGNGAITLQPHIASKIKTFEVIDTKSLQQFLGLINYARPFLKDLHKLSGPLYSKLSLTGVKKFNTEDYKQIDKIRQLVKKLPLLKLLYVQNYGKLYTQKC